MDFWVIDSANDMKEIVAFIIFCLCALAYGGVHASAWNDYFPTSTERLLWRISAILVAALGIVGMVLILGVQFGSYIENEMVVDKIFSNRISKWHSCGRASLNLIQSLVRVLSDILDAFIDSQDEWRDNMFKALMALGFWFIFSIILATLVLYGLFWSFLVVEAFISLRQLPALAYTTPSWPQYLPHL